MKWKDELELAVRAAQAAGECLRDAATRPRKVLSEIGRDIKLQADQDAEARILEVLKTSPYPILAEESGEHGMEGCNGPAWIVDPLDGTLNFNRGVPICCTSIALAQGEDLLLGLIYDFNRDELFTGIAGEGAWLNGAPMRVSDVNEPGKAILTTGFPTNRDYADDSLLEFVQYIQRFKKVRLLGSAALMLAYVACGRFEAYAEDDIMFWDVAGGAALVLAAGGYVEMRPSARFKWGRHIRASSAGSVWPR